MKQAQGRPRRTTESQGGHRDQGAAALATATAGRGQRGVVAGVFALAIDRPVGQPHGRMKKVDDLQPALHEHDPQVAAADVGVGRVEAHQGGASSPNAG